MTRIVLSVVLLTAFVSSALAQTWPGVEASLGRQGMVQDDMLKFTFPRSDLKVRMGEIVIDPGLALTSWIAFKESAGTTMIMGDLVLVNGEVAPVMSRLIAEGIEITALHNHLLGTEPAIMYLHFSGHGNAKKLASAMHSAFALTGTPMVVPSQQIQPENRLDWSKTEKILARVGSKKGDLIQFSFPRKEIIEEHGAIIPPFMGMATGINMQAVGNKAATTGDFVLIADEVNQVVKALVSHNLAVTAIHGHMLHETPRLFFLHFWGYDEPEKLALGLKAALGNINYK